MITCKECGHDFDDLRKLGIHLITHKMTSKEYYDKYLKKEDEGVCQCCGEEAKYLNLKEGYIRWCCRQCRDKDPLFRKTLSNAVKNSYTPDLLNTRKTDMQRRWANGSMDEAAAKTKATQSTQEFKEKQRERIKNSESFHKHFKDPHWIEAQSESHVKLWNEGRCFTLYEFNGVKYHSAWEIYFAYYLQKNGIKYDYQCEPITYLFEGARHKYIPDFCVNGELIEIKGGHLLNYMKRINTLDHAKYECMIANNVKIISDISEYQKLFEQDFGKDFIRSLKRK